MAQDDQEPDKSRVQDSSINRQRGRTEGVESALEGTDQLLSEHKYPTTSEELSAEYGDEEIDLPNETETLGSVLDRLVDERFETKEEAREAIFKEVTGEAGGDEEYGDTRDLSQLDDEAGEEES